MTDDLANMMADSRWGQPALDAPVILALFFKSVVDAVHVRTGGPCLVFVQCAAFGSHAIEAVKGEAAYCASTSVTEVPACLCIQGEARHAPVALPLELGVSINRRKSDREYRSCLRHKGRTAANGAILLQLNMKHDWPPTHHGRFA